MEFVLERYNYWIIIVLMMGGLYIVFEAENMIKKLVGLSIFQTSVLFLYVTLGKVANGEAPIYKYGDPRMGHHGDDHLGDEGHAAAGHGAASSAYGDGSAHGDDGHHEGDMPADTHAPVAHDGDHSATTGGSHGASYESHLNQDHHDAGYDAAHGSTYGAEEFIYSNPLPHVLMLTAIVVGVATLAVGLALVVRVREAYGTIEMDEVRQADIARGQVEGDAA